MKIQRLPAKETIPLGDRPPRKSHVGSDPTSFPNPAAPVSPALRTVLTAVHEQCNCSYGQARSAIAGLGGFVSKLRKQGYGTLQVKPERMKLPEWALLGKLLADKDSLATKLVYANLLQSTRYEVAIEVDTKAGTVRVVRSFPGS